MPSRRNDASEGGHNLIRWLKYASVTLSPENLGFTEEHSDWYPTPSHESWAMSSSEIIQSEWFDAEIDGGRTGFCSPRCGVQRNPHSKEAHSILSCTMFNGHFR